MTYVIVVAVFVFVALVGLVGMCVVWRRQQRGIANRRDGGTSAERGENENFMAGRITAGTPPPAVPPRSTALIPAAYEEVIETEPYMVPCTGTIAHLAALPQPSAHAANVEHSPMVCATSGRTYLDDKCYVAHTNDGDYEYYELPRVSSVLVHIARLASDA